MKAPSKSSHSDQDNESVKSENASKKEQSSPPINKKPLNKIILNGMDLEAADKMKRIAAINPSFSKKLGISEDYHKSNMISIVTAVSKLVNKIYTPDQYPDENQLDKEDSKNWLENETTKNFEKNDSISHFQKTYLQQRSSVRTPTTNNMKKWDSRISLKSTFFKNDNKGFSDFKKTDKKEQKPRNSKRMNLLERLHLTMIVKKFSIEDKQNQKLWFLHHLIDKSKDNDSFTQQRNVLFNEYRMLFNEKDTQLDDFDQIMIPALKTFWKEMNLMSSILEQLKLDQMNHSDHITHLQDERMMNFERNFVNIVEKNDIEKLQTRDVTSVCQKIVYRLLYVWYCITNVCSIIIKHFMFETCSISVILLNSVFLAMEDPTSSVQSPIIQLFETIFLVLYTIEMVLKILGMGFVIKRNSYLRDTWNVLDFIIVTSAFLPLLIGGGGGGINLSALRSLRVLRPLKSISKIKKLKAIIITVFNAMPYLFEIVVVTLFVFLIFAIAGLQLFSGFLLKRCFIESTGQTYYKDESKSLMCAGTDDCPGGFICGKQLENPEWGVTNFDNVMSSFLMVFQITTLEGWSMIMIYMQKTFTTLSVFYFILLVFIGNLF